MNWLLPLMLLVAPIKVETGQFNIIQDGKKIATEQYSITKIQTGYRIEGKTTLDNISSKMEVDENLVPTFYEYTKGQGTIRVKVNTPLSEFETTAEGGQPQSIDFRFPDKGIILDNNFFHHFLILMYRLQAGETMFSVFVPQDMRVGSASIRPTGPAASTSM